MICPIMTVKRDGQYSNIDCKGWECGFWCQRISRCSVTALSEITNVLTELMYAIKDSQ